MQIKSYLTQTRNHCKVSRSHQQRPGKHRARASHRPSLNHWDILQPVNWWYWETKIGYYICTGFEQKSSAPKNKSQEPAEIGSTSHHIQPGAPSTCWLRIPHWNLFSPRELTKFNHYGDGTKRNARDSILIAVGPLSNHLLTVALQNLGNLHSVATGRSRKTASSSSSFVVIVHESSCRRSGGRWSRGSSSCCCCCCCSSSVLSRKACKEGP